MELSGDVWEVLDGVKGVFDKRFKVINLVVEEVCEIGFMVVEFVVKGWDVLMKIIERIVDNF